MSKIVYTTNTRAHPNCSINAGISGDPEPSDVIGVGLGNGVSEVYREIKSDITYSTSLVNSFTNKIMTSSQPTL